MLPDPTQCSKLAACLSKTMKFHEETTSGRNLITGYGEHHVLVGAARYETSLAVLPDDVLDTWGSAGFSGLTQEDFEQLRDTGVEIVLIGTGATQRFPHPSLLQPLMEARIGYEVMDLGAACRTYNVLAGEGRRVLAALLLD